MALVAISQYQNLYEALLAKGKIESAGIDCRLADDNLVRMDWFYSNAVGGVKLLVAEGELAEAQAVLNAPMPEEFSKEQVGSHYTQPRCPSCGSLNISVIALNRP